MVRFDRNKHTSFMSRAVVHRETVVRRFFYWDGAVSRAVAWSQKWHNSGWLQAAKLKRKHLLDLGEDVLSCLDTQGLLKLGSTCRSLRGLVLGHLVEARTRAFKEICVQGPA